MTCIRPCLAPDVTEAIRPRRKRTADSDTKAEWIALANADRCAAEALKHPPAVSHPLRPAGGSLSRL